MIYNYTRCESVIAKIMADLDSNMVEQRTTDIKEWIFEAVDKIGAPMQYIRKELGTDEDPVLMIEDNQVPIPQDLVVLDAVAYSTKEDGPWTQMVPTNRTFREPVKKRKIQDAEHAPMQEKVITSQSQLYTINTTKYVDAMFPNGVNEQPEYFVKPGWIVTNKQTGYIKLAYKAIAVDERGYPLIPDLSSYLEAVYWYVVMKLSFPGFMNGTLSGGASKYAGKYSQQSYFYIQQQWNFYRNQAYAEAMMPTTDDMIAIKHEWNKLVPEIDSSDTFYNSVNKQQNIYTDYYYGY